MDRDMYGPEHEGPDLDDLDAGLCDNSSEHDNSYEGERALRYAESCDGFSCGDED